MHQASGKSIEEERLVPLFDDDDAHEMRASTASSTRLDWQRCLTPIDANRRQP